MEKRNELSSLEKTSLGFKGKVKGVVSYVARGIKDAAQDYAHPVRNTVLTLGMAAYIGCAGPGSTSVSDDYEEDVTAPTIVLEGANPYETFVGDSFVEEGYSASDDVDGDLTSRVSSSSNDNVNKEGSYTVNYSVSDNAGNSTESSRAINRNIEPGLAEKLNTIVTYDGVQMKASEALDKIGFQLNRGTELESVIGNYLASGEITRFPGSTGSPSFSNVTVSLLNKREYEIDMTMNGLNYVNVVNTGSSLEKTSVSGFVDTDSDNISDWLTFCNIENVANGKKIVNRVSFGVNGNTYGYATSETWTPVSE